MPSISCWLTPKSRSLFRAAAAKSPTPPPRVAKMSSWAVLNNSGL